MKKALLTISILVVFLLSSLGLTAPTPLTVHFIDVGQADSILVHTPAGKNMLIDAGNNADADTITAYLNNRKVSKIDILVGTHPHEDHIGSMDVVIRQYNVGKIYMPKKTTNTRTFEDVLLAIKSKGLKVYSPVPGTLIELDPAVKIKILAPNNLSYEDMNDYSIVLKITYGKTSFLLTGDAERLSEKEMLAKGYDLKAEVLKVGHHGSSSSTSASFLRAVAPKYAVISVGMDNDYGHPAESTLNRLERAGVKIYRTDLNGTVVAESDGEKISINTKK